MTAHVLLALLLASTGFAQESKARAIALTHVTLVDTVNGKLKPDVTVIIVGDRIRTIQPGSASSKGAQIVDGRGKFLMPGLFDMHVHLSWSPSALPVLLANGITSVRDLGSDLQQIDDWRARINAGVSAGPHIYRAGPILNGKSFNKYQMVPGTAEETRGVARGLKAAGVDFFKVHRRMERDAYFALVDEAKKLGLTVVGHIPITVTPEEALDAGQRTIEHWATLFEGTFTAAHPDETQFTAAIRKWNQEESEKLFARFVKNGTYFDPTLVAYRPEDPAAPPDARMQYVAESLKEEAAKQPQPKMTKEQFADAQALFAEGCEVVRRANHAGVMILAGTDLAATRIPGFRLHEELALLVECGLSPLQALQAATFNPAKLLNKTGELGIEEGKIADLLLLDADPLADVHNTQKIAAVIQGGRLFRRTEIEGLLREGKEQSAKK